MQISRACVGGGEQQTFAAGDARFQPTTKDFLKNRGPKRCLISHKHSKGYLAYNENNTVQKFYPLYNFRRRFVGNS